MKFLVWISIFGALAACDTSCKLTVYDVAQVQNTTGQSLSLKLCKEGPLNKGEYDVIIPANSNVNEIAVGTHEGSQIKGGLRVKDACSSVGDGKEYRDISLAPVSFGGAVKLCSDDTKKNHKIIPSTDTCPQDWYEQTSADPC